MHQDSESQTRKGDSYCVEITSQEHDIENQLMGQLERWLCS